VVVVAVRVLQDVGRDADAGILADRHSEIQIDALDVELVRMHAARRGLAGRVGDELIVAVDDAGEVERRGLDRLLRAEGGRSERDHRGDDPTGGSEWTRGHELVLKSEEREVPSNERVRSVRRGANLCEA